MIDYTLPLTSQAIHPLIRKITLQWESLKQLISYNHDYFVQENNKLEFWKNTELAKCQKSSMQFVNKEECDIMCDYSLHKAKIVTIEGSFMHAVLILCYSYFESIISAMCIEKSIKVENSIRTNVQRLLDKCKETFSAITQEKFDYLVGDLKAVRNHLIHNYNGTEKQNQLDAADREVNKRIGLTKLSEVDYQITPQYVQQALDKEYDVLMELATMLRL